MMGLCLQKLGVRLGDTHDIMNRSRFHCFEPEQHIKGDYHKWYYRYDAYKAKHVSITLIITYQAKHQICHFIFYCFKAMR